MEILESCSAIIVWCGDRGTEEETETQMSFGGIHANSFVLGSFGWCFGLWKQ